MEVKKRGQKVEKDLLATRKLLSAKEVAASELYEKMRHARMTVDEARSSVNSTQSQGQVLSGLTRLRDTGRLKGFHGRLGNLGTIDEKYDVAVSTACPALNNLIVDDVATAQAGIEHLRKNNLGRAVFSVLDQIPKRNLQPIKTPENAPRLFDLIKPQEERYAAAFYNVLQDTLVANDLDQANRIAYGAQRYRVVTLDGNLIDKSGTMSGGGTRVSKGAMNAKPISATSPAALAKLDSDLSKLEKEHIKIQSEMRQLNDCLQSQQDEIPNLEMVLSKHALEISAIERSMEDAMKQISELR